MLSFTSYLRTTKTEEEVLAAFVRAVEPQLQPPQEKAGVEGSAHWGEMRWRERAFDPVDGVSYGPAVFARAVRESDGVVIRGSVRPSPAYWLMPVLGAVGSTAIFAMAKAQGMPFGLPNEFSWLFVAAAAWLIVRAFTDLQSYRMRAAAFAAKLLEEEPNQSAQTSLDYPLPPPCVKPHRKP